MDNAEPSAESVALESLTLTREYADDVGELLQDYESRGPWHTTLQMISNSTDARAKRLDILLDFHSRVYRFTDDGEGMLPRPHIQSMINFGGSLKRKNRTKEDGTRTAGYRGIALVSLGTLCEELYLETLREGTRSVIEKQFNGPPKEGEPFEVKTFETSKEAHGTTFELRGLKFKPTKDFNFDYLVRWIPWHRAITPSFQIFVSDGEKNIQLLPRSMENPDFTFRIDETMPDAGHVYGAIYISRKSVPEAGIYVSVNGETIGKTEDHFTWSNLQVGFARKTTVVVEANGCEKALTAEKTAFRQGHPATEQLKEILKNSLLQARRIYEHEIGKLRLQSFSPQGNLTQLRKELERKEAPVVYVDEPASAIVKKALNPKSTTLLTKLGLPPDIRFKMSEYAPHLWGEYDPANKIIRVNSHHYSLAVTENTTPLDYRFRLKNAIINILAGASTVSKDDFFRVQAQLWKLQTGESELEKEVIIPQLVYSVADIARLASRPLGAIRYMETAGLFPNSRDGILGRDYLRLEERTLGWSTLYEMVKPRDELRLQILLDKFSESLSKAGDSARLYARDLGVTGKCYFTAAICEDALFKTMKDIEAADTVVAIRDRFQELGEVSYPADGLVRKCTGLTSAKVQEIFDYADKHRIPITTQSRAGTTAYLFKDFVGVYGQMHSLNGKSRYT